MTPPIPLCHNKFPVDKNIFCVIMIAENQENDEEKSKIPNFPERDARFQIRSYTDHIDQIWERRWEHFTADVSEDQL